MAAWRLHVGPQWWMHDLGAWRLVGLDTALMGSDLPEEAEQAAFLAEALATRWARLRNSKAPELRCRMPTTHQASG